MASPPGPLIELLLELYRASAGLSAFFTGGERLQPILRSLPGTDAARETLVAVAVEQLQAQRFDDQSLFNRLAKRFTGKRARIEEASSAYRARADASRVYRQAAGAAA